MDTLTITETDLPTIMVEVLGGVVTDVCPVGNYQPPLRVLIRDYDNLMQDPEAKDTEYSLGIHLDL